MKSLKAKLIILLIAMLVITMLLPLHSVSAANEGVQLIKTTNGDVVIYVEGLENQNFDYALSDKTGATDMDLKYINSVQDDNGNQVALIEANAFKESENNLYIRTEDNNVRHIVLDFNNMFTQEKLEKVKDTSNRIGTKVLEDIIDRKETVNGKDYTYKVGGLEITDDQNAQYSYVMVKLPNNEYDELQKLADELNSDKYESETMYSKIELANNFYNVYSKLIENANWSPVDKSKQIKQPSDAKEGDQYIVLLKKVAEDGTTTYDAKFMTSKLVKDEGEAQTAEVKKQETSKLPITGDSIILFVILAVLVIVAIIVFVKMRKSNKKADK